MDGRGAVRAVPEPCDDRRVDHRLSLRPAAATCALLLAVLVAAIGCGDDNDNTQRSPAVDAPALSPAHAGAAGDYGMFTQAGGRAVGAVVDRARASLERGSTRETVLARVRQDMLKLYEDEATGEVGDTDVCEQVAAALSRALVEHDQQPISACDEILE
jgi:hypothetical protein